MAKKKSDVKVKIDYCKGCNLCIDFCKQNVLRNSGKLNIQGYDYAEKDPEKECTGCMLCVQMCPEVAIEVYSE